MVSWLLIIIVSYLFFGLFSFGDKLLLSGPVSPKSYTFYVGLLNGLAIILIPFTSFGLPSASAAAWIIADAIVFILGLYVMFLALQRFEVSRVMPTIGALQPIFILIATWVLFGFQMINAKDFLAFFILLLGTFFIAKERRLSIHGDYVFFTLMASLLFSLDYVFAKMVFSQQPFLQGLIWTRIVVCALVLLLLLGKKFRQEVFAKKPIATKNNAVVFILTQSSGALATLLQSLAIALAPVGYLAIMNALRGVQYVFLFGVALMFSSLLPNIFKEEISQRIIIQKSLAILLIIIGLAVLVLH